VAEAGRALDARDVLHVTGRVVVAVVDHTPIVARAIDAGLLLSRGRVLREFAQLRDWIAQIVSEEAPLRSSRVTPSVPQDQRPGAPGLPTSAGCALRNQPVCATSLPPLNWPPDGVAFSRSVGAVRWSSS
jgi:hypothetical protein